LSADVGVISGVPSVLEVGANVDGSVVIGLEELPPIFVLDGLQPNNIMAKTVTKKIDIARFIQYTSCLLK
jgi:hypothetical protein